MALMFATILFMIFGVVYCAPPEIPCPIPLALENGQAIPYEGGNAVEYVCEAGYDLKGKAIVHCIEGKWEEFDSVCLETKRESESTLNTSDTASINGEIQLGTLSKDAVPLDDEGYQSDEALNQHLAYLYAYHYPYYYQYGTGSRGVMTLTESQFAWINSLHPELRDQYLKNMHIIRVGESSTPERTQALVARDAYNYIYSLPYIRSPVSRIVDNVASTYDYSCNQAGYPVIEAPKLPNMRVARYDSQKNRYEPHNYYLSAVYQCDAGHYMLDSRFSELYCSRGQWVGHSPVCVSY